MPIVEVSLAQGRGSDRIRALISALTEAVESALQVEKQRIRVIVREVPRTHWAAGDVTLQERDNRV